MRLPEAHAAARPPRFCSCITLRGRFAVERRSAVMRVSAGRRSPVAGQWEPGSRAAGKASVFLVRAGCEAHTDTPGATIPSDARTSMSPVRAGCGPRSRSAETWVREAAPRSSRRLFQPDRTGPTRTDHRLAVSGALPKSTVRHRVRIGFPSQSFGSCTEWSTDRLGPHRVGMPPHFKLSVRRGPGRRRARAVALNGPSRDIAPPSTILDNPQSFPSRACGRAEGRASGVERSH